MSPKTTITSSGKTSESLFPGLVGAWLGLALLKFGNPVILDRMVEPPKDLYEFLIQPWPVSWGYWMLGALVLLGLRVWRWQTMAPYALVAWPLAWLGWQLVAGTQTVDWRLTQPTLVHFGSCVVCFYLGHFALSQMRSLNTLLIALLFGFLMVILIGFQQHFGGLEETRRYFYLYELPKLTQAPSPELLKKLESDRIYSTLFYPNTLAGTIILVLPMTMAFLWQSPRLTKAARVFVLGAVCLSSMLCLFWSGSKAGWLIVLAMALVAFFRLPIPGKIKSVIVSLILVAGLAGFFIKYSDYFKGGATSVGARFDYWAAALQIIKEKPVFGSGPGTFSVLYHQFKSPESEMARLAHNDYLQQGSDSGVIGLLLYFGLIVGLLAFLYRNSFKNSDGFSFSVWLGLGGLAVQGTWEFGLFIPALSWPQFMFLGWLLAKAGNWFRNQIDNRPSISLTSPGE